ncbi:MAG: histidinol-phosphatase HisJ family protein [Oscillospiraceae bacterium]
MITADFHTHSSFSGDSEEPMCEMTRAAVSRGLKTLCITEHCDLDYPEEGFVPDFSAYKAAYDKTRADFGDKLELLFGVELGVMDYLAPRLNEIAGAWDFDFIIGSSHLVDGADPYYPEYFDRFGTHNGILRYFESILANVKAFDNFDVYGHLDYAVRYSAEKAYNPEDYRELLDEILRLLVQKGKGIELNTAGLRSGLPHCNPHPFILKRFRELGGEIVTIGSDAHKAADVARDFAAAEQTLKEAGFSRYTVFRKRKPAFVEI